MDTLRGCISEIYRFFISALVGALLITAVSLTGCSDDSLRNDGGPKVTHRWLHWSPAPLVGVVPLDVTLDARFLLTT